MFRWFKSLFRPALISEQQYQQEREKILKTAPIPVIWLFGKTGSGKTSVVKYLTGAADAEIGSGFKPQTKTSKQYDFPSPDHPVLRFFDTRGLAEGEYDPSEDIHKLSSAAHVMIVTVRAMDHALDRVIEPLKKIRSAQPRRPVLLALTCLHEAYPGMQHPSPDPFEEPISSHAVPLELERSIQHHREQFSGLVDRIHAIDLTKPEEGFQQPDFGGDRLKATLLDMLPGAYRQTFLNLDEAMQPLKDLNDRRAMPYVIGYSTMAAGAAAVPTPWIDIPVVMAIQSHLVYRLQSLYGQQIDTGVIRRFSAAVGGRLVSRMVIRESLKLFPVVGVAANAALAYAYTYGLGRTCCWYFGEVLAGNAPGDDEVKSVWKEQLSLAAKLWGRHQQQRDR